MTTSALQRAADAFAAELARWRTERGLTKKQLAEQMRFDPSYVSHVEGRRHRPTADFAKRAEAVLRAGGAIWMRFTEYEELRRSPRSDSALGRDPPLAEAWLPAGTGLIVEQEVASLSYMDGTYLCTIQRSLYNAGADPVTRYPVRISVDRYPADPERSNRYYREHPLTWAELDLVATYGDDPSERMEWRTLHDRDSFKEVWLLFENAQSRFPLYRGQRATIKYSYRVGEDKWGQWFQRAIRLPTRQLVVRLDFPASMAPAVWGVQTSLTAESALGTPVVESMQGDRVIFDWFTDNPPLHSRYRIEWRFRGTVPPAPERTTPPVVRARETRDRTMRASEWMRAMGIVQRGSDLLHRSSRPVDLPTEEPMAREVVVRLLTALDRICELAPSGKGMGLAAPQLGLDLAAAVVRPAQDNADPVVLLNPRVVGGSAEVDEQYEACLSFFDVRGLVRRPLRIVVEHQRYGGEKVVTTFEDGLARLIGHVVDHLEGRLYVDRMVPGTALVPASEPFSTLPYRPSRR